MITLIIGIVGIVVDFLLTKGYSFIFFAQNIDFFVSIKYANVDKWMYYII